MRFNFDFTAAQTLWTLMFAALLVLLVVLLGRDRARRFPWFTASIALMALRMLASRLLVGRMAPIPLNAFFITLALALAVVGLLVLAEVARTAFGGVPRSIWIVNAVGMTAVACGVVAMWGPWPAWKTLTANSQLAALRLMDLAAERLALLVELLTVQVGLLVVVFGRRFKAGWRSHVQQIAIGLSTVAISELVLLGILRLLQTTAAVHSQAEVSRLQALWERLVNGSSVVYLAAVVWWIVWLWIEEPGAGAETPAAGAGDGEPAEVPAEAGVEAHGASPAPSQRPSSVMPIGVTSNFSRSMASKIEAAESSETSCSPLRPPNKNPTRSFFAILYLILIRRAEACKIAYRATDRSGLPPGSKDSDNRFWGGPAIEYCLGLVPSLSIPTKHGITEQRDNEGLPCRLNRSRSRTTAL